MLAAADLRATILFGGILRDPSNTTAASPSTTTTAIHDLLNWQALAHKDSIGLKTTVVKHSRRDPRRFEGKQEDPDRTPTIRSQQRDLSPVFPSGNDCEEHTVLEIQSEDQLSNRFKPSHAVM